MVTKFGAVVFLLSVMVLCGWGMPDNPKYNAKFDQIDVDQILRNGRLFNNFVKCFLDEGPCTGDGRELREILPEALESGCAKCTDTQKRSVGKVLSYILQEKRDVWNKLMAKYDPDGKIQKAHGIDQEDDDEDEDKK